VNEEVFVRRMAPHTATAAAKNRAFWARSTEWGIAESAVGDFQPVGKARV
jgi:hypothetical protein